MTKTVAAYIRVSTDGQVDKYGLEAQKKDILVYCSRNDMYVSKWYIDGGVSGVKEDRAEWNKILYGEVENPPFDAVVVAKNDRVARDIKLYYYFKMLLMKKEVELISVAEDFGEFGVMAHFLEAFTLCVAEMERENIKNRTSAGRAVKKAKGGYAGGRCPYGYKVQDHVLVVDEDAACAIRRVFELRKEGLTMKGIAEVLNAEGRVTKGGKRFDISAVQNVLKREDFYRGTMKYNGEYEGIQEKILV